MNAKENHANQSELIEKHTETVDWLSSSILWKSELQDLQKMLYEKAAVPTSRKSDVDADHFQLMIRHNLDEIEKLRNKLLNDETMLAKLIESNDDSMTLGSDEHTSTMRQVESFSKAYRQFRKEFFEFTLSVKSYEG